MNYTIIRDYAQISAPSESSSHVLRGLVVSRHRTRKAALRKLQERQREVSQLPASWKPSLAAIEEQGAEEGSVWGTVLV